MTTFAVSFIAGTAAFHFFPFFPATMVAVCIALMSYLFIRYRKEKKKILPLILIFLFSLFYSSARHADVPALSLPDSDISVAGTLVDVPEKGNKKLHVTLDRVFVEGREIRGKIRLVVFPEFFEDRDRESLLAPGVRIRAIAKLKGPHILQNPGVYSYDLKKDGIAAAGYMKNIQLAGKSEGFVEWVHEMRRRLGRIMDNSLSPESAALHKAIVPGLKRGISIEMRDAFSTAGLAHILSISGTHFGLLAFIMFKGMKMAVLLLPERVLVKHTLYITPTQIAALVTVPVLVLYTLISGAGTPTIRSFIMVCIYMIAVFLGRKDQWLNSLSIAAVLIFLWKPEALFELSFQLSFLAVLSIGFVFEHRTRKRVEASLRGDPFRKHRTQGPVEASLRGDPLREHWPDIFERLKAAMMMTVAAVLGTAPLVALYFKQFPLISPVTNVLITPLICFVVLPLGFFSGFTALIFNLDTMPLSGMADWITHFALELIKVFSHVPYASLHVHNPSCMVVVLYYLSLFSIFRKKTPIHWRLLPVFLVLCIYIISPHLSDAHTKVTFLDVGQGDASVVELPDKKIMLVDGGMYEPDMGRRVIAPYLWAKGISEIDYMILSHPHSDHFGGLMYIMDNFHVGEIWSNGMPVPGSEVLFQKVGEKNVPYKTLSRGDVLEKESFKVYVFHPYNGFYADSSRGEVSGQNSDSLVFKIETGDMSVLFTGDIEMEAEENLLHLGKWLESDIIKVPHHGSSTSNSTEFIRTVHPETAVVSAGRHNPFRHPHQETLDRYRDAGVQILRTDLDGAVTVVSAGSGYKVKTYGDSSFREVKGWQDELRNLGLLF